MTRISAKAAIKALHEYRGNLSAAADSLGCTRQTLYNLAERDESVAAALAESRERLIDKAETVVADKIEQGDLGAARFVLQTIGSHRGYVERTHVTQEGDHTVRVEVVRVDD